MSWRFIAQSLPDGQIIDPELPLSGAQITTTLSGPGGLSGNVPVEVGRLKGEDGLPILKEWGAAIWAEQDGEIRGGGIIDTSGLSGSEWSIECVGISGYLKDLPYVGDGEVWSSVDPLHVTRVIWEHAQSFPDGDMGIIVDDTTSPVRIGEEQYIPLDQSLADSDTTFDDGPIRLNWWDVHDLGAMVDEMAERGRFDYLEQTTWSADGEGLEHRIRLFYPRRGRRRTDLRFVAGENLMQIPTYDMVEEGYASQVMVLGAGEGREKLQGFATAGRGRLRRVAIVSDDGIKRRADINDRARREAAKRVGLREITQVEVWDHPNAAIGSWDVGDEIRIQGQMGWADVDTWMRVVGQTISPQDGATATLDLARMP